MIQIFVLAENSADVSNFTAQLVVKGKIDNLYVCVIKCVYLLLLWFTQLISHKNAPHIAPLELFRFTSEVI